MPNSQGFILLIIAAMVLTAVDGIWPFLKPSQQTPAKQQVAPQPQQPQAQLLPTAQVKQQNADASVQPGAMPKPQTPQQPQQPKQKAAQPQQKVVVQNAKTQGVQPPIAKNPYDDLPNRIEDMLVMEQEQRCKACYTFVGTILTLVRDSDDVKKAMQTAGDSFCTMLDQTDKNHIQTCKMLVGIAGPQIIQFLLNEWSKEKLCAGMLNCPTKETYDLSMAKLFEGIDSKANDTIELEFGNQKFLIDDIKCDGCHYLLSYMNKEQLLPIVMGQIMKYVCAFMATTFYPLASSACTLVPYIIKPLIPKQLTNSIPVDAICNAYRNCGTIKPGTTRIRTLIDDKNLKIPADGLCTQCHKAVERYESEAMRSLAVYVEKHGLCGFIPLAKLDKLFGWTVGDCIAGAWRMAGTAGDGTFSSINTYAVCRDYRFCGVNTYSSTAWLEEQFPDVSSINDACKSCSVIVQFTNSQLQTPRVHKTINTTLSTQCSALGPGIQSECLYMLNTHLGDSLDALAQELDNDKEICTNQIGVCGKGWAAKLAEFFGLIKSQQTPAVVTPLQCVRVEVKRISGSFGITLDRLYTNPSIPRYVISGMYKGGGAQASGLLKVGDIIDEADGAPIRHLNMPDAVQLLRSAKDPVRLLIRRGGGPYDFCK